MPAAIARIARMTAKPPNEMNADRPVRMSQIANNRKPIFFVNFMVIYTFLPYDYGETAYTHPTTNAPWPHPTTGECFSPPLGGYIPEAKRSGRSVF
jgi:hypothetical protein